MSWASRRDKPEKKRKERWLAAVSAPVHSRRKPWPNDPCKRPMPMLFNVQSCRTGRPSLLRQSSQSLACHLWQTPSVDVVCSLVLAGLARTGSRLAAGPTAPLFGPDLLIFWQVKAHISVSTTYWLHALLQVIISVVFHWSQSPENPAPPRHGVHRRPVPWLHSQDYHFPYVVHHA